MRVYSLETLWKTWLWKSTTVVRPWARWSYREAKIHQIKCGWLSCQESTFISRIAILPVARRYVVNTTEVLRGKYAIQTLIKELTLSQKSLWVKRSSICCTLFTLKCLIYKWFFFFNINRPVVEEESPSLRLPIIQDGYFFN